MKQAFDSWAEYRKKILYGGMKTLKTNGGEIVWHPGVFRFAPDIKATGLCQPYHAQNERKDRVRREVRPKKLPVLVRRSRVERLKELQPSSYDS